VIEFNIYTLSDLMLDSGLVQGRMAVGGNATLGSISIGGGLSEIRDVLIAAADLSCASGAVLNGNVAYGVTATLSNLSIPNGPPPRHWELIAGF